MARTKNPSAATVKAWKTRKRNAANSRTPSENRRATVAAIEAELAKADAEFTEVQNRIMSGTARPGDDRLILTTGDRMSTLARQLRRGQDALSLDAAWTPARDAGRGIVRQSGHDYSSEAKASAGDLSRKVPPAWWSEKSTNRLDRGMTEGEVVLDWLARYKIPKRGDRFVMYHATPKASGFDSLRAGSYLTDDVETARHQAGRDRGLKAGALRVHEVVFYPWEVRPSGPWAVTAAPIPLGREV